MAVLVTGAGLIGSWIARDLVERGERPVLFDIKPQTELIGATVDLNEVKIVQGDVLDLAGVRRTIEENGVDRVIHSAALLSSGQRERPLDIVNVNIMGTGNILEASRLANVKRVVFCGSTTVYVGAFEALQGKLSAEDFEMRFLTNRPRPLYATTKVASEYLGFNFRDLFGLDFAAVRYAGVFGPWPGPMTSLTGMLIDQMLSKPLRGEPADLVEPVYWRGGEEFIYVKDAARGTVMTCLAPELKSRVYNLGMGQMYKLDEVAEMIRKTIPGASITIRPEDVGDVGSAPLVRTHPNDVALAREELDFETSFGMEEALVDYIKWMKRQNHLDI